MNEHTIELGNLLIALGLGLLIGLERGWAERSAEEGSRVAGIRTFGLISLLGALWQLLDGGGERSLLSLSFAAFAMLMVASSYLEIKQKGDYSITTPVAALIAFALGALAMTPHVMLAVASAVITAILLGLKPVLHASLRKMEPQELAAVLKLLLISCVLLPVLPNREIDPWDTFNPFQVWWMVVAISAISFSGYFAIKIAGASRGILLTGFFAGLVSSTAATLSMSRMSRQQPELQRLLAAGATMASTTMFLRALLIAGFISPALFKPLLWPVLMMAVLGYGVVLWLLKNSSHAVCRGAVDLKNPFEFGMALRFGGLLALIMLLTRLLQDAYGNTGVFLMAGITGTSDVDAFTISTARMTHKGYSISHATIAIMVAMMVNTGVKAGMAFWLGTAQMGQIVAGTLCGTIAVGIATLCWLSW